MKRVFASIVVLTLLLSFTDVFALSEPLSGSEGSYKDYEKLLFSLQKDIAVIHRELSGEKNLQAVYEHMLHTVESTAVLIGKAEPASQNVKDGLQFNLKSQLEKIIIFGLSEEQEESLKALGYTEEDIDNLIYSLAVYNDFCYHAANANEYSVEQVERLRSIGFTDEQILRFKNTMEKYYAEARRSQQVIKEHQSGLMHVQTLLSALSLRMLFELEEEKGKEKEKGMKNGEGKRSLETLSEIEKRLLDAIETVSEDHSSLERVKAYSKHVYKKAEHEILKGNTQYLFDFFVGLQVHCGALTALNGDIEFGIAEIKLYEPVVAQYALSSERPELSFSPVSTQSQSQDNYSVYSARPKGKSHGKVKESNEENNVGLVITHIKAADVTEHEYSSMIHEFCSKHVVPSVTQQAIQHFLEKVLHVGSKGSFLFSVGGVLFSIIISAPTVGGGWVQDVFDPTGIFDRIYIDSETVEKIEKDKEDENLMDCEREGFWQISEDPIQILYAVQGAVRVYRGPDGLYYYYALFNNGYQRVVVVEDKGHEVGRVVTAFQVICKEYKCSYNSEYEHYEFIFHWWDCEGYALIWIK